MSRRALRRRYGHARKAAWLSATVRTPANDRAADAAFRKARKEEEAVGRDWQWAMMVSTGVGDFKTDRSESERRAAAERAEKLLKQSSELRDIIEAAKKYAKLPKVSS